MPPDNKYELEARNAGIKLIAGIDEAGRGPLAGPVVAAAVILDIDANIEGINDSKLLSSKQRDKLFSKIHQNALSIGLSIVEPETIDRINILQATRLAMTKAITNLAFKPGLLLIDGPITLDINTRQIPIIKGDRLSISISAASIIAKVTRDGIMKSFHNMYPEYGFYKNKGYGTKEHVAALKKYGPCKIHRKSFAGIGEYYGENFVGG
jgi:ribonuclease HII